jgi:hypothetical protein
MLESQPIHPIQELTGQTLRLLNTLTSKVLPNSHIGVLFKLLLSKVDYAYKKRLLHLILRGFIF